MTPMYVTASSCEMPNNSVIRARLAATAPTSPITTPTTLSRIPLRTTSARMALREAPSAASCPNLAGSFRYAAGKHAVQAGCGEQQSDQREASKQEQREVALCFGGGQYFLRIVATRTIGWFLSTDQIALRTADASNAASPLVRTTIDCTESTHGHWVVVV